MWLCFLLSPKDDAMIPCRNNGSDNVCADVKVIDLNDWTLDTYFFLFDMYTLEFKLKVKLN